jgi:two-component system, NtrC family, C4-dicarboxylate transport response regulator DctD
MDDPWTPPNPAIPDGATVLVVEDDANVRRAVRRMLQLNGAMVVEAADGGEAIDLIEADRDGLLEAVVTDLRMPNVSGSELIAVLQECRPDLPLVAVTAVDELLDTVHGVPLLPKPFTEEQLLGTLGALVAQARAMRARARLTRADAGESRAIARQQLGVAQERQVVMGQLHASLARLRSQLGLTP